MRSFRRSSKKSEDDQSYTGSENRGTSFDMPPLSQLSTTSTGSHIGSHTPIGSPILYQNSQFTPPPSHSNHPNSASSSTSLSSPKKLLTPIRNLFHSSSNSKSSTNIATTNDNLNNALFNTSKNSKSSQPQQNHRQKALHYLDGYHQSRHKRNSNSISSLQAIELEPVKSKVTHSQSQLSLQEYRQKAAVNKTTATTAPTSINGGPSTGFSHTFNATTLPFPINKPPPLQASISSNKPINSTTEGSQTSLVSHSASLHSSPSATLSSQTISTVPSKSSSSSQIPLITLKPPILLKALKSLQIDEEDGDRDISINNSVESITPSEFQFKTMTRKVSFKEKAEILNKDPSSIADSESYLDPGSGSDSDSSQFSFVKDMRGGRNSSVKYYKRDVKPMGSKSKANTFNQNDLNYEVEDYSDYDFENNGMDDYDDDGEEEEEIGYNNAFEDDIVNEEGIGYNNSFNDGDSASLNLNNLEIPNKVVHETNDPNSGDNLDPNFIIKEETDHLSLHFHSNTLNKPRKFNHSYHMSMQGFESLTENASHDLINDSENAADDILENYLDSPLPSIAKDSDPNINTIYSNNKSPQPGSISQNPAQFEYDLPDSGLNTDLFEVNSPLINGVTIGSNLRHRLGRPVSTDVETNESVDTTSPTYNISSKATNSFIHRETDVNKSDKEIFQKRIYKSFHGSISDDFDSIVSKKLKEHDKFSNSRGEDVINEVDEHKEEFGLGLDITDKTSPSLVTETSQTNRNSVNDMMNILQQFNVSFDNSSKSAIETNSGNGEETRNNKRMSILNLMSVLENVEREETSSSLKKQQRDSIIGVMNLLANLEGDNSEVNSNTISSFLRQLEMPKIDDNSENDVVYELANKLTDSLSGGLKSNPNRKSINDMMDILAHFDVGTETNTFSSTKKNRVSQMDDINQITPVANKECKRNLIPKKQRYSWFNDDESISFANTSTKKSTLGLKSTAGKDFVLDESIIDEINQLPEDFDFEEYQNKQDQNQNLKGKLAQSGPGFYRSNSYNNKPIRAGVDNKAQSNKIETLNKTVTFYRSGSPLHSDVNRSRSISRAPSTRSTNSFVSISETEGENIEEEEAPEIEILPSTLPPAVDRKKEYARKIAEDELRSPRRLTFENKSCDSIVKNNLLGTITESPVFK